MSKLLPPWLALTFALVACTTTVTSSPPSNPAVPAEGEEGDEEGAAEEAPPANLEPYTQAEVQKLFDARCLKCHGPTNALLNLSAPFTRATVGVETNAGASGSQDRGFCASSKFVTRIVPGDREASLLWHKVKGTHDCGSEMPYDTGNKKLNATELERLGLWIDGLAKAD